MIAAVAGVRRKGSRWNDHRHVNRSGQRRQRRRMIGDPLGRRRCERNPFRRFHTFAGTLSSHLRLKNRLPVESSKLKGQRDQLLTEVMRAVVFCPVVLIVVLSRKFVGAFPGVPGFVA